jgi:hypothetical protein
MENDAVYPAGPPVSLTVYVPGSNPMYDVPATDPGCGEPPTSLAPSFRCTEKSDAEALPPETTFITLMVAEPDGGSDGQPLASRNGIGVPMLLSSLNT